MPPVLRHIANLWTLMGHPSTAAEWSLETKLHAIRDACFDGVCWAPVPGLKEGCQRLGLQFIGGMASGDPSAFHSLLHDLRDAGAIHVNVQLAADDIDPAHAFELTSALFRAAHPLGLLPAIETHRGTATETPEKFYALADRWQQLTGQLLPTSFDFSHFAVVKHLVPKDFARRLLIRPDLIQHAQQFHLRPFNGHHAQVPITTSTGALTLEVQEWIPFARDLLACWLDANRHTGREIFLCPELGPPKAATPSPPSPTAGTTRRFSAPSSTTSGTRPSPNAHRPIRRAYSAGPHPITCQNTR